MFTLSTIMRETITAPLVILKAIVKLRRIYIAIDIKIKILIMSKIIDPNTYNNNNNVNEKKSISP